MRTCESGLQVFWLTFRTSKEAATFRGIAENRVTDNGHTARCDFVSFREYTSACGRSRDVWLYLEGHERGTSGAEPFAIAPTDSNVTSASLAERLGLQVTVSRKRVRRGTRGGQARKPKDGSAPDPADGGAL